MKVVGSHISYYIKNENYYQDIKSPVYKVSGGYLRIGDIVIHKTDIGNAYYSIDKNTLTITLPIGHFIIHKPTDDFIYDFYITCCNKNKSLKNVMKCYNFENNSNFLKKKQDIDKYIELMRRTPIPVDILKLIKKY